MTLSLMMILFRLCSSLFFRRIQDWTLMGRGVVVVVVTHVLIILILILGKLILKLVQTLPSNHRHILWRK